MTGIKTASISMLQAQIRADQAEIQRLRGQLWRTLCLLREWSGELNRRPDLRARSTALVDEMKDF